MRAYEIGLSALRTHQRTLSVLGNNIANAATPGYHRQRVELVNRLPQLDGNQIMGTGVEIGNIRRMIDTATEDAILRNDALRGLVQEELSVATEIESLFAPGDSSIHERFSVFFNNLEAVANSPEVDTVRQELLASADDLLYQFSNIRSGLAQASHTRRSELEGAVQEINRAVSEIADLNLQIRTERARGREPLDLLDRRDAVAGELAQWTDVSIDQRTDGREVVRLGGGLITINDRAPELSLEQGEHGWGIVADNASQPIPLASGRLQGLLLAINEIIPDTLDRLETLAATIVQSVDAQHARGLTEAGAYDTLRGSRDVQHTNVPLYHSGITFPLYDGEMTLTVTDPDTGNRTSHRIAVDPYVDTLQDITARLDAIDGVTASLSDVTGRLVISGNGQHQVDFAGRIDNVPDLSSFAGTSVPSFSGHYTGAANDELTVTFNKAGTIGVTEDLTATFVNSEGQVVGTLEVGNGYEAGTSLDLADGVAVQFSSGTVTASDTASVLVTASSDTSGLLAALGVNSLFEGHDIRTFEVRRDIRNSPELLAISRTGFTGESGNISDVAGTRDERFDVLNGRTFIEELADMTAAAGMEVQYSQNQSVQLESYGRRLLEQRDSVSGVNNDEEFLEMLEVERAFQAAARFINTVDETINEVFRIID